nr:hypothetical protein [Candidatus Borrelia fainii]
MIFCLTSKIVPIIFSNLDFSELVNTFISIFASIVVFKSFAVQTLVGIFRASVVFLEPVEFLIFIFILR